MTIENAYLRTAPCGRTIKITPKNQAQLEYYRSLEEHGYIYKPAPVIHNTKEVCTSCEG